MTDLIDRLTSALADRYTLDHELGAGGMATVYAAHDLKHDRRVAVKVLRPELAAVLGAERFLQEIKTTANLQHPHILPLFDSGEADSFLYYVMPCVEGESLRDKLNREKQLGIDETVKITTAVASALDHAHRRDVIHRDIKPENILLQDGMALVADFGIALAVSTAGRERLTETGMSLGTPWYMSPEQASGEGNLDGRADLYALACVTYEMLVGEPPYTGPTAQAIIAKRLTDPIPSPRRLRDAVPLSIDRAVTTALAKLPVDRYESCGAFITALEAPAEAASAERRSLVVLPFVDLNPDPDGDFLGDGLTDELITDLSRTEGLRVIASDSAMRLKGTEKDLRTIGRELNVRYALQGRVRRAGRNVRITAQLVDTGDNAPVWGNKFRGTLDDVFDLQEEVSQSIAEALQLTLAPTVRGSVTSGSRNFQTYECFLRARKEVWRGTSEGLEKALEVIQTGMDSFGEDEMLCAAMGNTHVEAANFLLGPPARHLQSAEEWIHKVYRHNPNSSYGYLLNAKVKYKRGDVQDAIRLLKQSLTINPNERDTIFYVGAIYMFSGRPDYAKPRLRKLLDIDPLTPISQYWWAWAELHAGNPEVALDPIGRLFEASVDLDAVAGFFYVMTLAFNHHLEKLYAVADRLMREAPDNYLARVAGSIAYALRHERRQALDMLTEETRDLVWWDEHGSWCVADIYAVLGETDEALTWLEHAALDRGFINYPLLNEYDPLLANIRGDQRFKDLMERVKERWERFEV